ncbi:MAG: C40 family peptidase, partial [Muribaculaceae bacterium]|nr:C40 family peptidase [Muribaculaceae bacterium]
GDLVFFCTSGGSRVNHVGLYIGSGKMIHASLSQGVTESSLDEKYYRQRFHSAGRVVNVGKNAHVNQPADTSSATTLPSDRRELKNRIKQIEKEKKQLSKAQNKPENKPAIKTSKQPEKKPEKQSIIQQQQIETDSTYVTTDPSIFD